MTRAFFPVFMETILYPEFLHLHGDLVPKEAKRCFQSAVRFRASGGVEQRRSDPMRGTAWIQGCTQGKTETTRPIVLGRIRQGIAPGNDTDTHSPPEGEKG